MNRVEVFNEYRPLLFSIAYRMLGSVMDAEDIVQEAFVRWHRAGEEEIASPKAYLSAIVTRLSIDQLRSARVQREVYVGPWLPEPLVTEQAPDLTRTAELADSLSVAFLVLLESLSPLERAVFLLRQVFDYDYAEIASIVDKSEANCRQMVHRAQQHLNQRRPRYDVTREQQERLTQQFLETCANGDMEGLLALLTNDIVVYSDSGGKAPAARNPIYGSERVARFILGLLAKFEKLMIGRAVRPTEINGQPAIIIYIMGQPYAVWTLEFTPDRIQGIKVILNPDKLHGLPSPD